MYYVVVHSKLLTPCQIAIAVAEVTGIQLYGQRDTSR